MADNATKFDTKRQNGSILTFILIAFVLLALTSGAVLLAKWRGDSARTNQTEVATSNNTESEKSDESTNGSNSKDDEESTSQSNQSTGSSDEDAPVAQPESQNLASAGPTDIWVSLTALTGLSYALARFLLSRNIRKTF